MTRFTDLWMQSFLQHYGIKDFVVRDSEYVICGNFENPALGIVHRKCIEGFSIYNELISKFHIHYKDNVFDCDDYAMLFKIAFSLAGVNSAIYADGSRIGSYGWYPHTFNLLPWAVDKNGENVILLMIEPQLSPWGGITVARRDKELGCVGDLLGYMYRVLRVEV